MLIGILGRMGSGKDTVAKELVETYGFRQDSFAATLKDITSQIFGWDRELLSGGSLESRAFREEVDEWWSEKLGIPNFTPRLALQLLGTDVFRNNFHENIWVLSAMRRYQDGEHVVISDARFPNEVQTIREMGGHIIRVDRGEEPEWWPIAKGAAEGREVALKAMKEHYKIHASEWAWANEVPDEVLMNNGTLEQLYGMVKLLDNKYNFSA